MTSRHIPLVRTLSLAVSTSALAFAMPAQAAVPFDMVMQSSPGVSYLTASPTPLV